MIVNPIVDRIFEYFGIVGNKSAFVIGNEEFKLDKTIKIEMDTGEIIEHPIYAASGQVGDLLLKVMFVDLSLNEPEYNLEQVLLLQMNDLTVYVLKRETDSEELVNTAYCAQENNSWFELTNLLLAKLLVGIEQLDEIFVTYKPYSDYQELYKYLVGYLNYVESKQNDHQA